MKMSFIIAGRTGSMGVGLPLDETRPQPSLSCSNLPASSDLGVFLRNHWPKVQAVLSLLSQTYRKSVS